ncbi:MAG TPA: glycosyltransferase family 2 protein [Candidatus Binatia bacterium]|nr:glycosyltransferase family 2 protein [Candidatus Binatia bacterium]
MANVWVVVPAYKETATIVTVVASLRAEGYEQICVVDDGSRDDTGALALAAGAHVLHHLVNLGQGAALQTGITYALVQGAEYVCTFDADGQHAPRSVTDLLEALQQSGADVALGSRFLGKECHVPPLRRLLLRAALAFTHLHARVPVTDTHNGLRLFTRRAAQAIRIEQAGMAHASEILQKLGASRLRFVEVPVEVRYTAYSRKKGQSGFDSIKILLDLLYRSIALRS